MKVYFMSVVMLVWEAKSIVISEVEHWIQVQIVQFFFAVLMSNRNILHYPSSASESVFRTCEAQSPGKLMLQ